MPTDSRGGVLVVEEQPLVARGLVSLLRDELGVVVVIGSPGRESLARDLAEISPRLVVVGVGADVSQARERLAAIRNVDRSCRIAVLVPAGLRIEPVDLVDFDVVSVISRSASLDEVVVSVRQALSGRISLDSETTAKLLSALTSASSSADVPRFSPLTRREIQVLRLVSRGLPNRDIAVELHISENTVKNHLRSVHEKLGVRSRTEAVMKAAKNGLIPIPS